VWGHSEWRRAAGRPVIFVARGGWAFLLSFTGWSKPEKVQPNIEPIRLYTLGFQEWSHCGLRLRGWIQMHDQMSRVVVRGRGARSGSRFGLSLDVVGGIPRSKVQA